MSNTPQTGTPSQTALATTLVSSSAITGAAFALGQKPQLGAVVDAGKTLSSKNPIASQRIVYGTRGQLGGVLTYATTSPTTSTQHDLGIPISDNGNIQMVFTMAGHEIDGFLGATVTDVHGTMAAVPLVIYLDGYQVPLTVNGAPAFGGDFTSYVDYGFLGMDLAYAPVDGGYYVPTDFVPPNINGKYDKAHDYRWRIRAEIDNGDPSNTSQPFPLLASDTSSDNPGPWDSTCLQRGCAKAHVQLVWDKDRFNNGLPAITFDIAGKKVYDPRLSPPGYAFSSNVALCLNDYLTDTKFGLAVDSSLIDQTLFVAAANACDYAMALREGGTQPRYACNGVVEASMKRGDVLQKLLDAMGGTLVPPGNIWKMYAGGYSDSVLSITDSDLRGPIKLDSAVSRKDLVNGAKGTFCSPDNNWQAADYPPYVNATYVVDDGGTVTSVDGHNVYSGTSFTDFSLDFVSDSVQAQRLAKIKVEKIRHKQPLILQCKLMAFAVEVNDVISFTHARFGLSAATYVVTNTALVVDAKGDAPVIGCDLVCVPASADDYAWDADTDEGTVTICTAPLLPDNTNVGAPGGFGSPPALGLESDDTTTITRADGVAHSQIEVTWTPPTDHLVLSGGYIEIFIKAVGDPTYQLAGTAAGDADQFFIANNITDGIDYDVMIQSLNAAGAHSEGLSGSIICSGTASSISGGGLPPGPVGIANNDFEAGSTIPPASWVAFDSPTLTYETSSQQQGLRSLKVSTSTIHAGVYSEAKVAVVPGDMFTGETYKVGGFLKGDGTGHGTISFRFFDSTDTEVGTPVIADGGSPTPADWTFYSAVGPVPSTAVYGRVYLQNASSSGAVVLEFDCIVLFRVASMEDEVVNGPTRGAITAANSSYRPLTNPLTAVDDGYSGSPATDTTEIDIAAFTMRSAIGPTDISISSGAITGLLPNTTYHVYYDDPSYTGGAVTYYANTTQAIALDATGRFYVGSIRTPEAGGLPTIGNNDGGTGAQSGKLYQLSPTLRADYDVNGNQTWYPANHEETDGSTTSAFDLITEDTIWLGGVPTGSVWEKWTSLKLKICSEVDSVTAAGAAFLDYSLDDGQNWTNIYNVIFGSDDVEAATAGANDGGGGTAWTNPGNLADPNSYATITGAAHGTTSQNDQATGFGFALPSGATIDGITVSFDEIDGGSAEPAEQAQFIVQLLKAGTPVGTPKPINGKGTATLQAGNNVDLWGTTWSQSDINDANFGFEIAAVAPVSLGSWATGTYYSPMGLVIDSNGNYQIVVTPGTSNGSAPSWATTPLGSTTAEGGASLLVWALYQIAGLTYSGAQTWATGNAGYAPNASLPNGVQNTPHFITATAGGTSCVFELTAGRMPRLGGMQVYAWPAPVQGAVNLQYPLGNPPSAPKVFDGASAIESLHWYNSYPYDVTQEFKWFAVNGNGTVGSGTTMGEDSSSHLGAWQCTAVGQMQFPAPGNYVFKLWHDDGMLLAFDPDMASKVSGTYWNVNASQRSAVLGYAWMAGQNASTTYGGGGETAYNGNPSYLTITVKTPAGYDGVSAIVVGFELAYMNWEHSGRMIVTCQDSTGTYQEIVPTATTLKTAASAPTWPAWSSSFAPAWPSVTDAGGNFVWVNRGPATDFAWVASTIFTAAGSVITGTNGYKETAYRAGVDGGTEPVWLASAGALLLDGSTLICRNLGGYTPSTSFDFSIRNATIDVAYLPSGASNTRAKATDSVTLGLTQPLGNLQVRYGLTLGGEIKVYEVWVEAQAG